MLWIQWGLKKAFRLLLLAVLLLLGSFEAIAQATEPVRILTDVQTHELNGHVEFIFDVSATDPPRKDSFTAGSVISLSASP